MSPYKMIGVGEIESQFQNLIINNRENPVKDYSGKSKIQRRKSIQRREEVALIHDGQ